MYPNNPFSPDQTPPPALQPVMSSNSLANPLAPPPVPPRKDSSKRLVTIIAVLSVVGLVLAGGLTWALINYFDARNNVDTTVAAAEATVRRDVVTEYEARFLEFQKNPFDTFAGPDDYGRLSFEYPRFWSVYVESDASRGGTYEAYLNPGAVPPISSTSQLALRVTIETKDYDQVVESFQSRVASGELKSQTVTINGESGTRLDGNFTKDIRGSAVVFRIRDKAVTLQTDAATFRDDFNKIVASITFNK